MADSNSKAKRLPVDPRWTLIERFWYYVQRPDGCWKWNGHTNGHGYGLLWMSGKNVSAHRLAWEIHCGAIPSGLNVLHRCDNPSCVNPDHLFLGTHQDNMTDMATKGRAVMIGRLGESHPLHKLTDDDVRDIRRLRATGWRCRQIAVLYQVNHQTVSKIVNRRAWKHV